MKQVVGTQAEVTDDYKEYLGSINWKITSGNSIATFINNNGTEGNVSITNSGNLSIRAIINNNYIDKSISATYYITDYYITSFADLQELERVINNSTESTIALTKNQNSLYSPIDGNGLSNAHIRLTNDINCGQSNVHIGYLIDYSSKDDINKFKPFRGRFDGSGFSIYNIGGSIYYHEQSNNNNKYYGYLFEVTQDAYVFNFSISGEITKTNYRNGLIGVSYNTKIKRIYTNIRTDIGYANSANQIWEITLGDLGTTIEDILMNDDVVASLVSGANGFENSSINRICSISKVRNIGTNNSTPHGVAYLRSGTIITNCCFIGYSMSARNLSPQTNDDYIADCYGVAANYGNNKTIRNIYAVRTGGSNGLKQTWIIRKGSTTGNVISNCYFDYTKNAMTIQSDEGATSKSTQQLKAGNIFLNNNNWIEKQGYYPILNNQFAIRPEMLTAIRA